MNVRIFDLKMLSVSELRMLEYDIFQSIMADGKCDFLKKLMLYINMGCGGGGVFFAFLFGY